MNRSHFTIRHSLQCHRVRSLAIVLQRSSSGRQTRAAPLRPWATSNNPKLRPTQRCSVRKIHREGLIGSFRSATQADGAAKIVAAISVLQRAPPELPQALATLNICLESNSSAYTTVTVLIVLKVLGASPARYRDQAARDSNNPCISLCRHPLCQQVQLRFTRAPVWTSSSPGSARQAACGSRTTTSRSAGVGCGSTRRP